MLELSYTIFYYIDAVFADRPEEEGACLVSSEWHILILDKCVGWRICKLYFQDFTVLTLRWSGNSNLTKAKKNDACRITIQIFHDSKQRMLETIIQKSIIDFGYLKTNAWRAVRPHPEGKSVYSFYGHPPSCSHLALTCLGWPDHKWTALTSQFTPGITMRLTHASPVTTGDHILHPRSICK